MRSWEPAPRKSKGRRGIPTVTWTRRHRGWPREVKSSSTASMKLRDTVLCRCAPWGVGMITETVSNTDGTRPLYRSHPTIPDRILSPLSKRPDVKFPMEGLRCSCAGQEDRYQNHSGRRRGPLSQTGRPHQADPPAPAPASAGTERPPAAPQRSSSIVQASALLSLQRRDPMEHTHLRIALRVTNDERSGTEAEPWRARVSPVPSSVEGRAAGRSNAERPAG